MRAAVFSFIKPAKNSTVASTRIARFLAETLEAELVWDDKVREIDPDVLFLVNGAFAFCNHLEALADAVLLAPRVVWVQNDYTIVPPKTVSNAQSPFRRAFVLRHEAGLPDINYWTTVKKNVTREHDRYINWNALTTDPTFFGRQEVDAGHAGDLFYYGAFRADRVPTFDKWFFESSVPVTISSNAQKMDQRYNLIATIERGMRRDMFLKELAGHGLGLYIEDKKSHTEFHSPANRFYEMLSAGLPMVFEPDSVPMLKEAGFDVSDYTVSDPRNLCHLMANRDRIRIEQRVWMKDYVAELEATVKTNWSELL